MTAAANSCEKKQLAFNCSRSMPLNGLRAVFEHKPAQSSNLLVLQPLLRHINQAASEIALVTDIEPWDNQQAFALSRCAFISRETVLLISDDIKYCQASLLSDYVMRHASYAPNV
jgi:hypothetical protein